METRASAGQDHLHQDPRRSLLFPKDDIPDSLYLEIREPRYEAIAKMYNAAVIAGDQEKQTMLDEVMAVIDEVVPPLKK